MQPPEKPQSVEYFIDRENYVQGFKELVEQTDTVQIISDTEGTYGLGKTTMLSRLYEDVKASDPLLPVWLSLSQFSIHFVNPALSLRLDSVEALAQNLTSYYELLIALGEGLLPSLRDALAQFHTRLLKEFLGREAGIDPGLLNPADLHIETWLKIAGTDFTRLGDVPVTLEADDSLLGEAMLDAVRALTQEFARRFNARGDARRVVLFADDYCWISDQFIGAWFFNDLIPQLDNTMIVLARTESVLPDERRKIHLLPLGNFTPEEVSEYLEKRLPRAVLPPHMAESIFRFSRGHAQTVCLAADLLKYGADNEAEVMRVFDHLHGSAGESFQALIENLFESVRKRDPRLAQALEVGAVVRRFDQELLSKVLEEAFGFSAGENGGDDLVRALEKYSFVEVHHDRQGIYHAFHNFVREQMEEVLIARDRRNGSSRYEALHQAVADYYNEWIAAYEDQQESETDFVRLFRYEDPEWQFVMSEWLYHTAHLEDRADAHFNFVRTYFAAFQWWGAYLEFPFCERLLTQWEWTQRQADQELLQIIRKFHNGYPHGYYPTKRGKGNWLEVREAIFTLRQQFGLEGDPLQADEEHRALWGVLDELLSDAYMYSVPPDLEKAEAALQEAIRIFEYDQDDWNASYQYVYLAEVYLRQGEIDQAIEKASTSNALGRQEEIGDGEVIALSHRVLGDACLRQGHYEQAAQQYTDACFFTYWQQFTPVPPDPYTTQLHRDLCLDITGQLLALWREGRTAETLAILHHIQDFWQPYWDQEHSAPGCDLAAALHAADLEALAWCVFPRPTQVADGSKASTALVENMRRLLGRMAADL